MLFRSHRDRWQAALFTGGTSGIRRIAFNEQGIFRRYPELDIA